MKRTLAVTALSFALLVQPSSAQLVSPWERFAGQADERGNVCRPNRSERDMRVCAWMWVRAEEHALANVVAALEEKANDQPPAPTVAESGYAGSLASEGSQAEALAAAQVRWLAWRNDECVLGTIEAQGGSMRRLTYPNCIARLTAVRRGRLSALLALWNADFDGPRGRPYSAACALESDGCLQTH
jgi:uncharacterized protein YecT (DUF1311 family)